ncbi:hypothetical protein LEMLEM_LOCUS16084, partial [Lemmus lemmus]
WISEEDICNKKKWFSKRFYQVVLAHGVCIKLKFLLATFKALILSSAIQKVPMHLPPYKIQKVPMHLPPYIIQRSLCICLLT